MRARWLHSQIGSLDTCGPGLYQCCVAYLAGELVGQRFTIGRPLVLNLFGFPEGCYPVRGIPPQGSIWLTEGFPFVGGSIDSAQLLTVPGYPWRR